MRTVEQVGGIAANKFAALNKALHRLERFWTDQILYRLYAGADITDTKRGARALRFCSRVRALNPGCAPE